MAKLVLIRHGESEYNQKGLWTGWDNPDLDLEGVEEANNDAKFLHNFSFDLAYTSELKRAQETLEAIKIKLNQENLVTVKNKALNERNYGDYTGKNKWQIKEQIGEEEFEKLRRSWDYPVPNGETLKEVYEREIPYFKQEILPKLKQGQNILVVSSGNALRALIKFLEDIPDNKIATLEIATGEIFIYTVDSNGKITDKEIRAERKNNI